MSLFNRLVSTALSAVASALRDPPPVRPAAPRPRAVLCVQCGTEIDVTGTRGPTRDVCDACRASRDAARQRVKRAAEAAKRPPRYDNPDGLLTPKDLRARWGMSTDGVRKRLKNYGKDVRTVTYHGLTARAVTVEEADRIDAAARAVRANVPILGGHARAKAQAEAKAARPAAPAPAPKVYRPRAPKPVQAPDAADLIPCPECGKPMSPRDSRGRVRSVCSYSCVGVRGAKVAAVKRTAEAQARKATEAPAPKPKGPPLVKMEAPATPPSPVVQPIGSATAAYLKARFRLTSDTIRGRVLDGLLVPIPGTSPVQYTAESVALIERQYSRARRAA
jgi:hypothetical protein